MTGVEKFFSRMGTGIDLAIIAWSVKIMLSIQITNWKVLLADAVICYLIGSCTESILTRYIKKGV